MEHCGYEVYEKFIERFLKGYLRYLQVNYPAIFQLEEYCVASSIRDALRRRAETWGWPAHYHYFCERKKFIRTIYSYFRNMLNEIYDEHPVEQSSKQPLAITKCKTYSVLKPYRYRILLYLSEKQQLRQFDHFLENFKYPLLVVAHFPEPVDYRHSYKAAWCFAEEIEERCYTNAFVDRYFPHVSATYNRFDLISSIVKPPLILVGEGRLGTERIWADVGKRYHIPTVGLRYESSLPQTNGRNRLYNYSLPLIDAEEEKKLFALLNKIICINRQ